MEQYSIDTLALVQTLVRQVRVHLFDCVERCQVEAVQICVLLGTYYLYHGNPSLSWSVLGVAVKVAYALRMHREVEWQGDFALLQARKRAWGHTFIADTFAAAIYGRPATVDRSFCDVSYPDECDDTEIPLPLRAYLRSLNDGRDLSKLSYHRHKYGLYEIKAQIINEIYTLRARGAGIPGLVRIVQIFDNKLKAWKANLPLFFGECSWTSGDGDPGDVFLQLNARLSEIDASETEKQITKHLVMQKTALQLLYDYILILLHRPLLEYRMSSHRQKLSPLSNTADPFPQSFETCINAALRISFTPADRFEYNCPMALVIMHMLTAGVILCIPATMDPFSALAHTAKGAVVRMIKMFRRLSSHAPVVAQSCTILEELVKVVLKRELDLVLQPDQIDVKKSDSSVLQEDSTADPGNRGWPSIPSSSPHILQPKILQMTREGSISYPQEPMRNAVYAEANALVQDVGGSSKILNTEFEDNSLSTNSPEACEAGQTYDFTDIEPDHGFSMALGVLEKGV
jgi:hypothetical protein